MTGFTRTGHQSSAPPVTDTTLSYKVADIATSPTITARVLLPENVTLTNPDRTTAVRADCYLGCFRRALAITILTVRSRCSLPVTVNATTVDPRCRRRPNAINYPEKLTTIKARVISRPGSVHRKDTSSTVAATHTGLFSILV